MVTCSEYIFNNIDEALKYILETGGRRWLSKNFATVGVIEHGVSHVPKYEMGYVMSVHMEYIKIKKNSLCE